MKLIKLIFSHKISGITRLFCLSTLLAILFLLTSFGYQQLVDQKVALASPFNEDDLFKSKCGKCHDPELALKDYRSEEVWRDTITRMQEKHNSEISEEEAGLLVTYHVERQKQEIAIFKNKCEKCHPGKVFAEKNLAAEQARAIIKRMQQKAGNTIEDKDIEIIITYHARSHQTALKKKLEEFNEAQSKQPDLKKNIGLQEGMALFAEKCSDCHELDRALTLFKDPELWDQTIKRMQYYSKGAITDLEANELVDFHVTLQQREINTFKETCTQCHDEKRINNRSMTDEQWVATIKRMQQKAPELIPDEKINLLAAYFHRRELTMAKIFSGKCQLCHYRSLGETPFQSSRGEIGVVITLAYEEVGDSMQMKDLDSLLASHAQRQNREMQLYISNCRVCHIDGPPKKKRQNKEDKNIHSRAVRISFIATLQEQELNKESQNRINTQIDYHVSGH
jgi:mono/diheme cytochrome c family protein